jgi:GMP synthase-like glutamine amidotransferase
MILVVQFREDITREHEQKCISRYLGADHNVRFVSVFENEVQWDKPTEILRGVTKLVLGGSAGISMGPGHDNNDYTKADFILKTVGPLVRYVLQEDFPTLGTCFGHQLLGHFSGGSVVHDPEMAETGFASIQLNPGAQLDPVFEGIPNEFRAVVGHQDTVVGLPRHVQVLASTDRCATQALKFGNNIYTTQFHSEMDADDLMYRINLFPHYKQYAQSLDPVPTPYSVKILQNFLRV